MLPFPNAPRPQRAIQRFARTAAVLVAVTAPGTVHAQQPPTPAAPVFTKAIVIGGMQIGESQLALVKGEFTRGKWAMVSDLTRDGTRETWAATPTRARSRDEYVLWASSSAVRRYTRAGGHGFFAEAGAGMSQLTLRSRADDDAVTTRKGNIVMATWGAGTRVNLGGARSFVELAYRSAVPLQTRHLHIAATPPAGSTDEAVTYQSWYLGRAKPTGQFYAALGVRF